MEQLRKDIWFYFLESQRRRFKVNQDLGWWSIWIKMKDALAWNLQSTIEIEPCKVPSKWKH